MVTSLVEGVTRIKIIDCVRTWSEVNLESSSEPSNSTVNAPVTAAGADVAEGVGEKSMLGEGVTWITWPVASRAVCAAGMKYAMPPATDDIGRSSSTRAGMRQFARSSREISGSAGAPRLLNQLHAPPATRINPATEPSTTSSTVTSTEGTTVDTTRISDSTSIAATITPATPLSHGLLTHGLSTARSLHSSTANTVALGSMIPASAWKAVVISPSGACGMSTMAAARATMPVYEA